MACRKAADRALTELSGWMEKQRDEEETRMARIRNEQEQIWTPRHLLDSCCVKWLADGWETTTTGQRNGGAGGGSTGCSGGCGKGHPRIVFDWQQPQSFSYRGDGDSDDMNGTAVATISHKLDPFVRYFERLCDEGLATKMDNDKKEPNSSSTDCSCSCTYRLNGFLQVHLDRIEETGQFKSHLYKVSSPDALSASQRAHERHIDREDQLERDAKRRRKNDATATQADASSALTVFEQAMTVCGHQGLLLEHLDLAEIGWMRLTGRPSDNIVAKVAATMACTRLRQVRLSYSVLLDGMVQYRDTDPRREYRENTHRQQPLQHVRGNIQEDEGCIFISDNEGEIDEYGREIGNRIKKVEMYSVRGSRHALRNSANDDNENGQDSNTTSLVASNSSPSPDRFVPNEENEFHWESLVLSLAANPLTPSEGDFDFDYRGHVIRVYLEGCSTIVNPPEKDCLFSEQLEVARYHIDPRGLNVGVHTTDNKLTFEVTAKEDGVFPTSTSSNQQIQYRGSFRVREIKFDFGDLLGVFVRKKLPQEKLKMQEIRQKRPVTRSEKEYVKALAKAARDAPGSSSAYRGMKGW